MKWYACIILIASLLFGSCSQSEESAFLKQLKQNPTSNPRAAGWYADLSMAQKREYAEQIGQIVFESTDSPGFVVAIGKAQGLYPWALIVQEKDLGLCGGNSFKYMFRDDEWVEKQWGVVWSIRQQYKTIVSEGKVVFEEQESLKKIDWGVVDRIWTPAAGWRYVGPKLPKFGPKTEQEKNAITEIRKLGGYVPIDEGISEYRVESVSFQNRPTDEALEHVKHLPQLQSLYVITGKITDAGIENIKGLTELQELNLYWTRITDAGLKNLEGMTKLKILNLGHTQITDAGLKHLEGLTDIRDLDLSSTKITDAGLEHLKGLKQLKMLHISRTKVTRAGITNLQQTLPDCEIKR
ncbi:MAG: hypothetical protein JXM70_02545 [Pirellulales bacterium]|nr:hypothetical protein [Pirellulales bacterium]